MSVLLLLTALIVILLVFIGVLLVGLYEKSTNAVCMSRERLEGRTVLVTGGTAGMGLEIAREMAARGARVLIACPVPEEGARALLTLRQAVPNNPHVLFKPLDLASVTSTRNFAAEILATEDTLDILINNAGVGGPSTVTKDGLNFVMQVNYYGAFLLTLLLLPLLEKSGRPEKPSCIVNVSSASYVLGLHCLENTFLCTIPPIGYFLSKLYLVVFTRELARRLKHSNVVANNADPGAAGTNIFVTFSKYGFIITYIFWILFKTPREGAQTALHVALDKEAGVLSGEYFKNCKHVKTSIRACDRDLAKILWNKSASLMKLAEKELKIVTT